MRAHVWGLDVLRIFMWGNTFVVEVCVEVEVFQQQELRA